MDYCAMNKPIHNCKGFTLVELMMTLAISGIVAASVYTAYISQQRVYLAQDQVAEMQQNLRAAINLMASEMRMAGFDPTGTADSGIVQATAARFNFTQDITDNLGTATEGDGILGDPGEDITFGFSNANDANGDGVADAGASPLARSTNGGPFEPIADNIEAIEFLYTLESGARVLAPAGGEFDDIRAVTISALARAGQPDPQFTNTMTYVAASGATWDLNGAAAGNAPNDNFRRRLITVTINLRNMGL